MCLNDKQLFVIKDTTHGCYREPLRIEEQDHVNQTHFPRAPALERKMDAPGIPLGGVH